tara:strand:- start:350 stop:1141 length:792 start_codon:yes stop_codon:yes gene_type:complete
MKSNHPVLNFFYKATDILLPPRCCVTGEIVSDDGMITPESWTQVDFINAPYCMICGVPFPYEDADHDSKQVCGACIKTPPQYDIGRAAVAYNEMTRRILLQFKYGDQLHIADTLAKWLYQSAESEIKDADCIVPVPLHWRRMVYRRYNQSALIAQSLAKVSGTPVVHALKRTRYSGPQKGLGRKARLKNVRLAFGLSVPKEQLDGKRIVLIDDVMTSGATLNACSKTLKTAEPDKVTALCVARVLDDYEFKPDTNIPAEPLVY